MKYNTSEDFLGDESFVKWVKKIDNSTEKYWLSWLEENVDKAIHMNQAIALIKSIDYSRSNPLDDESVDRLLESILNNETAKQRNEFRVDFKSYWIAATFLLLMSSIAGYLLIRDDHQASVEVSATGTVEKSIPPGQKYNLILSDGTEVKINSGSRIRFPKVFVKNQRTIFLEGEAFFKIVKDERRPFIVETADLTIRVLGTSFNVKNDERTGITEVALVGGRLKVNNQKGSSIQLVPNELVRFGNSKIETRRFDPARVLAWVEGKIIFDNSSSDEVIDLLERWFGVKFELKNRDELFSGRYSGVYTNEKLSAILQGIGFVSGFDFEIKNNRVIVE